MQKNAKKMQFKFVCEKCDFYCNNKYNYEKHLQTKKHNTYQYLPQYLPKNAICVCGKKYTHKQSLYTHKKNCIKYLESINGNKIQYIQNEQKIPKQHTNTHKNGVHREKMQNAKKMLKNAKKMLKNANGNLGEFECECGRKYKHQASLSRHKKTCRHLQQCNTIITSENTDLVSSSDVTTLLMKLIDTNEDLKDQIIDLASKPRTVNNNSFNLNNFLNIQCKNAMNLSDFLDGIKITYDDLKFLSERGFVESFTNTFVKRLCNMDQTERPIHCTDHKRKAMIIKDNNEWKKDDDNKLLQGAIDEVNKKQISAYSKHNRERDPAFLDSDTNQLMNSHMIMNMCSYNSENKSRFHSDIFKIVAGNTKILK